MSAISAVSSVMTQSILMRPPPGPPPPTPPSTAGNSTSDSDNDSDGMAPSTSSNGRVLDISA